MLVTTRYDPLRLVTIRYDSLKSATILVVVVVVVVEEVDVSDDSLRSATTRYDPLQIYLLKTGFPLATCCAASPSLITDQRWECTGRSR